MLFCRKWIYAYACFWFFFDVLHFVSVRCLLASSAKTFLARTTTTDTTINKGCYSLSFVSTTLTRGSVGDALPNYACVGISNFKECCFPLRQEIWLDVWFANDLVTLLRCRSFDWLASSIDILCAQVSFCLDTLVGWPILTDCWQCCCRLPNSEAYDWFSCLLR